MNVYAKALAAEPIEAKPPLDETIKKLIRQHGKEAVRDATKRLTAGKVGRPKENDLPAFATTFEQDARDWLGGKDPSKRVSSRALAKQFAKDNPGHDQVTTFDRVYEKLRKERRRYFLVRAYEISESEYPADRHLSAIKAINGEMAHKVWDWIENRVVHEVEIFATQGGVIGAETTQKEIQAANFAASQRSGSRIGGLGLLSYMYGKIEANKPTTENGGEKPSD